jgi:hypothetical protein
MIFSEDRYTLFRIMLYPSSSENSENIARVSRQPRDLLRLTGSAEECLTLFIEGASRSWRGGGQCARWVPAVSLGRTCMKEVRSEVLSK